MAGGLAPGARGLVGPGAVSPPGRLGDGARGQREARASRTPDQGFCQLPHSTSPSDVVVSTSGDHLLSLGFCGSARRQAWREQFVWAPSWGANCGPRAS